MTLTRSDAVNLLIAMGFSGVQNWADVKIERRLSVVDQLRCPTQLRNNSHPCKATLDHVLRAIARKERVELGATSKAATPQTGRTVRHKRYGGDGFTRLNPGTNKSRHWLSGRILAEYADQDGWPLNPSNLEHLIDEVEATVLENRPKLKGNHKAAINAMAQARAVLHGYFTRLGELNND